MKAKRMSYDEQMKLIMECRQSGLSDYHWCQMHDINPGTFYNWISRMKKRGITLPESSGQGKVTTASAQEVVKLELVQNEKTVPRNTISSCKSSPAENAVAFEVVTQNTIIRVFQSTDRQMLEDLFRCLGGVLNAG